MNGTIDWSQNPILTIRRDSSSGEVSFNTDPTSQAFAFGSSIRVRVRFGWYNPNGGWVSMKLWIDKETVSITGLGVPQSTWTNVTYDALYRENVVMNRDEFEDRLYTIDMGTERIVRFRFRLEFSDWLKWSDERIVQQLGPHPTYSAFVDYVGDFSLPYVPITILYCPPGQDMYAASSQTRNYGTVTSIELSGEAGVRGGDSMTVRGGINAFIGSNVGVGNREDYSHALEESLRNSITYSYDWASTLIADNQRVIGRKYWGPLGDIFLLLKNPWFSVRADDQNNVEICASQLTTSRSQIVIVPAHALLRPGTDTVASAIPWQVRCKLLMLDPFIINLDQFFPPNTADPAVSLSVAADPYRDPSTGNYVLTQSGNNYGTSAGRNRACLIARYSIRNGVELDLSQREAINLTDTLTNATNYTTEVGEFSDGGVALKYLFGSDDGSGSIGINLGANNYTGSYTTVGIHSSVETVLGVSRSALCKLVRNQVVQDLDDIEIWWDKQFSTFMFRKVDPSAPVIQGQLLNPIGERVNNVIVTAIQFEAVAAKYPELFGRIRDGLPVELPDPKGPRELLDAIISEKAFTPDVLAGLIDALPTDVIAQTMTDARGRYVFNNLREGSFLVLAGDRKGKASVDERRAAMVLDLTNVRRLIDIRKSAVWELVSVLGISATLVSRFRKALFEADIGSDEEFDRLIREYGADAEAVPRRAIVRIGPERVRPNAVLITGRCVDVEGRPLRRLLVTLVEEERDRQIASTFTDALGRFRMTVRRQGNFLLQAGVRSMEMNISEGSLRIGQRQEINVDGVVRELSLRAATALEFRDALGVTFERATNIREAVRKAAERDPREIARDLTDAELLPEGWEARIRIRENDG